jgi:opacity protein-like surface antigen
VSSSHRRIIVPPFQRSLALVTFTLASAVGSAAGADTGLQIGARSGIQLLDDDELRAGNAFSIGAEARFSFDLSPLLVGLTFDHFFVEDRTLFQVGANALYDLPLGLSFLYPYLGVGVGLTSFALPETPGPQMTPGSPVTGDDSNGTRLGMNLLGGVRFDHVALPVVRPFAQVMLSIGPIDLFTIVGGVLFELAGS